MSCKSSGTFGPVFLRICLGVIFIWAGLGKVITTTTVTGSDVTLLKEMGVTPKTATVAGATGKAAKPEDSNELEVSNAYLLALSLKKAAVPVEGDGGGKMQLWPDALAKGKMPVYAAYACVLTELLGGALVLLGAITRLSAFGLASTMLIAMWLTQFGPAIQSGKTVLGFLPAHADALRADWSPLMLQFSLFCAAMALVFLGCGCLGIDRVLFGKSGGSPKPKAEPAQ
jgi:uncharacterized membrane protein YphA (DoxX/SURF4 family)